MPPSKRRRTAAATAASKQQQTLSFRSTKAGAHEPELLGKQAGKTATSKPQPEIADVEISDAVPEKELEESTTAPVTDDKPLAHPEPEVDEEEDEEEDEEAKIQAAAQAELDKEALAISDTKIKSYWAAKERERKAPRVHQEGLGVREKVLREFDMNSRYGPGIGIARIARWRRAQKLGLNPPIEVLSVLLKEEQKGEKGKADVEKSIMDELIMSSRLRGDAAIEA